jgi:uncharacterized protein (UPF0335 family)
MPRKPKSPDPAAGHDSVDRDRLRTLVARIESAEDERIAASEHVRGLYQEARGNGFDARALREVVRLRREDKTERDERQAVVDEYLAALGDFASTGLGQAAIARASQMMPPV